MENMIDLKNNGFVGFKTVAELKLDMSSVTEFPGVYVVIRNKISAPNFLEVGSGGYFKGENPNVETCLLEKKWINGEKVVYIGKAGTSLKRRIKQYIDFGSGKNVGHRGGRYIWQLEDHEDLIFCWKPVTDEDPAIVESQMLEDFFIDHCLRLPFANLRK